MSTYSYYHYVISKNSVEQCQVRNFTVLRETEDEKRWIIYWDTIFATFTGENTADFQLYLIFICIDLNIRFKKATLKIELKYSSAIYENLEKEYRNYRNVVII